MLNDTPINARFDKALVRAIDAYLDNASSRDADMLRRRFGLDTPAQTLAAIGKEYAVTRQRVDHIVQGCITAIRESMALPEDIAQDLVPDKINMLRAPLFPSLRQRMDSDKHFITLVEGVFGLTRYALHPLYKTQVSQDMFENFWCTHASPTQPDTLSRFLQDHHGLTRCAADNHIAQWLRDGTLILRKDDISPTNLHKTPAMANTLLDYPEGAPWETLQREGNAKGVGRTRFTTERLEPALPAAFERGWAYQSDRGTYCHTQYLQVDSKTVETALKTVAGHLDKLQQTTGVQSMKLFTQISLLETLHMDYYVLRHLVRTEGHRYHLTFDGQSNIDEVGFATTRA